MRYILLTILYSCIFGSIQTQNCEYFIHYDFEYIVDTVEHSMSVPEKYVLYRAEDDSRFLSYAQYYNDSINVNFHAKHPDPSVTGQVTNENVQRYVKLYKEHVRSNHRIKKSNYYIIRNHQSKICTNIIFDTYPKHFMKEYIQLDWTITNEKKAIKAIECRKAVTQYGGRTYIAWFAPDIPISDGPYVFSGLPGLIIQISDSRGWYKFELTNMDLDKSARFWEPESELFHRSYVELSRREYIRIMYKELTNPDVLPGVMGDVEEVKLNLIEKRKGRFDLLLEQM